MHHHFRTILPALACACAAACGGGGSAASSQQTLGRGPVIASDVAGALAAQADAVAASLDAGHGCAARGLSLRLMQSVDAAVSAGRIPPALTPQLQAAARALSSRIRCIPRPPDVPPAHRRHHDHGRKHGGGD